MTIRRGPDLVLPLYFAPYVLPQAATSLNGDSNIGFVLDAASPTPFIYGTNGTATVTCVCPGPQDFGIAQGPINPNVVKYYAQDDGFYGIGSYNGVTDGRFERGTSGGIYFYEGSLTPFGGMGGYVAKLPFVLYDQPELNADAVALETGYANYIYNITLGLGSVGLSPFTQDFLGVNVIALFNKYEDDTLYLMSQNGYTFQQALFNQQDVATGAGPSQTGELGCGIPNGIRQYGFPLYQNNTHIFFDAGTFFNQRKWVSWANFGPSYYTYSLNKELGEQQLTSAPTVFEGWDNVAVGEAMQTGYYKNAPDFFIGKTGPMFEGQGETPILYDAALSEYRFVKFIPHSTEATAMLALTEGMQIAYQETSGYFILINNDPSTFGIVFHTQALSIDYNGPTIPMPSSYSMPCFSPCVPNLAIG